MEQDFVDKIYDRIGFKENPLVKGDYESCKFTSCDLSNTDLSEIKFIDCIFHQLQPKRGSIIKNSIQGYSICELQNAGASFLQL